MRAFAPKRAKRAHLDRFRPGFESLSFSLPGKEDSAEAVGATYHGRPAGSFGDAAVLSFNGNKIMTTSGGGMLLSSDEDLIERARYLSTQARQPARYYQHSEIGYNYRLSNVLAALGRTQLSRLDGMIARRRAIREVYVEGLAGVPGVRSIGRDEGRSDTGHSSLVSRSNSWSAAPLCPAAQR